MNTPAASQHSVNVPNDYNITYNHFISALYKDVEKARRANKDAETLALAIDLIESAKMLDFKNVSKSLTNCYDGNVERNFTSPTFYESDDIKGQSWADKPQPLHGAEKWNEGRRKTSSGIAYALDEDGKPINPYFNYGISGRGLIGRYGPNHAVDCGALRVTVNQDGKPALSALGIIRNDNHLPALCGGFIEFQEYGDGHYPFGPDQVVHTQASEFFEEMISGSAELLPKYAGDVATHIEEVIKNREDILSRPMTDKQKAVLAAQITTHAKVEQVKKEDPLFFSALRQSFRNAHECYAGPVLNSYRNTNSSWMETQLTWFLLDEKKWETIKGRNKFNYDFKAGDDAQEVLWHEINPKLIGSAGGHAPLFCFLLSSYLINNEHDDQAVLDAIKEQATELVAFIADDTGKKPVTASKPEAALRP